MQQRILVTGGSGFIGTHVVARYAGTGVPVRNLDVCAPRSGAHADLWRRADLLDADAMRREFEEFRPTHVFHLGARTDLNGSTLADYRANTEGLGNLLDAAATVNELERIVFGSSRLVCRIGYQPRDDADYCPTTAYGESKAQGERVVRQRGVAAPYSWLIVRPTSIWGPWFGVPYRNFFDAVRRGRYLHPRRHRILKSFGYVGNSIHQLDRLMFAPRDRVHARMFYLCDYEPIEVRAWAELIREAFAARPVREVPFAGLRAAALAGDALEALGLRNAPLTSFRLANLTTEMLHDTAALEKVCGALPFSAAQGVRDTVEWIRNTPERSRNA